MKIKNFQKKKKKKKNFKHFSRYINYLLYLFITPQIIQSFSKNRSLKQKQLFYSELFK
jgi:hypothetical protein